REDLVGKLREGVNASYFSAEYRILLSNGQTRWLSSRGQVHNTVDGTPWILGATQDVTELKLAEDALRASERNLRTVFDRAPVGIKVTDIQGRLLQVNSAYCRFTGYSERELLSMHLQDM